MKLVFFGTPEPAARVLSALAEAEGFEPELVVTAPPRCKGRGRKLCPTQVAEVAEGLKLPVITPDNVSDPEVVACLEGLESKLAVIVAYGQILRQNVLDAFPLGLVNVHYSLLPRWRGAAPVERALLAGDKLTGVTLMQLVQKLDAGGIIAQNQLTIAEDQTAGELEAELTEQGIKLLIETLPRYAEGAIELVPQEESSATYAPKLTVEEAEIEWRKTAEQLAREVRAYNPRPGARVRFGDGWLIIYGAEALPDKGEGAQPVPGTILECIKQQGFVVKCGQGALLVKEVVPPGRRRMNGWAFLCGQRLRVGARL